MKILIFAHDCGLRGAERFVADEAAVLMGRGWDVTVVVPCQHGGLADYLKSKYIPTVIVRFFWWVGPGNLAGRVRRLLGNLIALPRLIRLIRSGRFDLIHSHSIACGVSALAARLARVPHVWHLHEPGPYAVSTDRLVFDLGENLSSLLGRWTRSRFVAVSSSVAQLFEQNFRLTEVDVHYQSIDIDSTVAVGDAPALAQINSWPVGARIVIVGSLVLWKDQMTAVRSLASVVKTRPDTRLFLVGDDPVGLGAKIDDLAFELGIAENVIRLGTMANAAPAICAADLCVVTSLDEGFGRVAVEAMLCKTPVISADVPVNREVAGDDNVDFFYALRSRRAFGKIIGGAIALRGGAAEPSAAGV